MPVTTAKAMVQKAYENGYAVAAINSNGGDYDIMRACLETAEELKAPLIINAYAKNARYQGMSYVGQAARHMSDAFAPNIPVAIHLDHGQRFADCVDALRSGFTSIMCDASDRPIEENIAITRKVVEVANAVGVSVEAEVGQLLTGESDPNCPLIVQLDDVEQFTAEVDVDMLAVAIGNSHGYYKGEPKINIQRLKEVRAITDIPLVLHGCTGIPEQVVKECIADGMAKINFGTMVRNNFLTYFNEAYRNTDHQGHPWRCRLYAKDKLKDDVRWILGLTGAEGRA